MSQTPEVLQQFVAKLDALVAAGGESQPEFWGSLGDAMRELVAKDDWLPDSMAVPHPQYYQQYCLYADPQDRFSVVSFVWGPGQATPIHDHTVWGVIGMLRGAETCQAFEVDQDTAPQPIGDIERLEPGQVGFVAPSIGDVHRVANAFDEPTAAISAKSTVTCFQKPGARPSRSSQATAIRCAHE